MPRDKSPDQSPEAIGRREIAAAAAGGPNYGFPDAELPSVKAAHAVVAKMSLACRELTFTIRDGLTFQSGAPLDAQAIADNFNAFRDATGDAGGPGQNAIFWPTVSDVQAPDATTVVCTMSAPFTAFPETLATEYRVASARDGADGLAQAHVLGPDLIITDLMMPERAGIALIGDVRARGLVVKILAISGGGRTSGPDLLPAAKTAGADAVLAKPFRKAELTRTVAALLV